MVCLVKQQPGVFQFVGLEDAAIPHFPNKAVTILTQIINGQHISIMLVSHQEHLI